MDSRRDQEAFDHALSVYIVVMLSLIVAIAMTACSPRVIEHVQRDTTYIERLQVDSLYRRDSIYIKDQGDTVYIYRERWRERYKYLRDTVRLVRVDSVAVEREKIVEVDKPLGKFQSLKIRAFWWLFIAVCILGAWLLRKPVMKLLRR